MKKMRLLFVLSLFLTSIPLVAQTEEEAKMVAQKFLQNKKGGTLSKLSTVKVIDGVSTGARAKGKAAAAVRAGGDVYAFNADNGGFAVVCTGNGNTAVAGYSDKGRVDVDNMPEAMKTWLLSYAASMTSASTESAENGPTYEGPTITPVAPLLKTQWGQGAPFNGQCPSNGKQTTLAGCVPVALAQVLNYYHSDHKGTGQLYYAHAESEMEYDINYANVTYDWGNMLNTYEYGKYSQAQADAVAKLMVECGIASKATYDYDKTSAYNPFVALNKYYGFDCTYLKRDYYVSGSSMWVSGKTYYQATSKWMKVIQDELAAGRPIIYSADDRKGHSIFEYPAQSHCFVIDGIDAENYVHCNWGWAGLDDGYYDIAMLNPSCMRFFHYEPGFNCNHEMIVGIQPSTQPYEEKVYMASQAFGEYHFLYTNSYESSKPWFYLFLTKDGVWVRYLGGYNTTLAGWPDLNRFKLNGSSSINVSGLEDGVYQVCIATQKANSGVYNYSPLPDALAPTIIIENNGANVTYQGFGEDGVVRDLTIENVTPASEIYAGTTFYLSVKGRGMDGNTDFIFRNVDTGAVYDGNNGGTTHVSFEHAYDNLTTTKVFKFMPKNRKNGFSMPVGHYKIELPEDETDVKMEGEYYIDVAERPAYPVMDGSDWCALGCNHGVYDELDEDYIYSYKLGYRTIGTQGKFELTSVRPRYTYANKVEEPVTVKVYMVNIDTGEEMPIGVDNEWVPGKAIDLHNCPTPLEGRFRIRSVYETNGIKRGGLIQYRNEDQDFYYNILHDSNTYDLSQLVSADVKKENGENHLQVVLKNKTQNKFYGRHVKALLYDKANDEISVELLSFPKLEVEPNGEYNVNLATVLKVNTEYDVWLQTAQSDQDYNYKNYVVDENNELARIHINKDSSTGVSVVSLSDKFFDEGESVKVYDMSGVLVKTMRASSHLVVDLQSQLSSGLYILKSAKKTVKFRN